MRVDVVMPQLGESVIEGVVVKWLLKVGDTVAKDQPLLEISTDKVDAEIPSPAAGTIVEILAEKLGRDVTVPPEPQFTGALGAALSALANARET